MLRSRTGQKAACWRPRPNRIVAPRSAADKLIGGIYVIIDPDHCGGRDIFDVAESVAAGGAAAIQLRNKRASKTVVTDQSRRISEICRANKTVFIVNDYPDIAAEVGAGGVHVGQGDMSISDCREILRPHQIVGKSNALLDEAIQSVSDCADYIAVGSIFTTNTKSDTRPAGLATLRAVADRVDAPIVAIGGINPTNITAVAEAGADCACVATAVTMAQDPTAATRELVERFAVAKSKQIQPKR